MKTPSQKIYQFTFTSSTTVMFATLTCEFGKGFSVTNRNFTLSIKDSRQCLLNLRKQFSRRHLLNLNKVRLTTQYLSPDQLMYLQNVRSSRFLIFLNFFSIGYRKSLIIDRLIAGTYVLSNSKILIYLISRWVQ